MKSKPKVGREAMEAICSAVDEEHSIFCLEQLGVPHRVINLLHDNGIRKIGDLVSRTEDQLLAISNLGKIQLGLVVNALARYHTIEDL